MFQQRMSQQMLVHKALDRLLRRQLWSDSIDIQMNTIQTELFLLLDELVPLIEREAEITK